MMKCVRAVIAGRVQGVGFRWHILQGARRLGLNGTVRNLADGRVELEAEGDDEAVDSLLDLARSGPSFSRVASVSVEEVPYTGKFDGFQIIR